MASPVPQDNDDDNDVIIGGGDHHGDAEGSHVGVIGSTNDDVEGTYDDGEAENDNENNN